MLLGLLVVCFLSFWLLPSPFAHQVLPETMWSPFVVSTQPLYKCLARTTRNDRQSPHSSFPLSSASPSSLPQSSQSSHCHLAVVPLVVWDPCHHSFVVPLLVYANPSLEVTQLSPSSPYPSPQAPVPARPPLVLPLCYHLRIPFHHSSHLWFPSTSPSSTCLPP